MYRPCSSSSWLLAPAEEKETAGLGAVDVLGVWGRSGRVATCRVPGASGPLRPRPPPDAVHVAH